MNENICCRRAVCVLCILSLPELKFEKPLLSLNQIRIVPFVKEE